MTNNLWDDLTSELGGGQIPTDPISLVKYAQSLAGKHNTTLEMASEAIKRFCRVALQCDDCGLWMSHGNEGDRCPGAGPCPDGTRHTGFLKRPTHLKDAVGGW